MSPLSAGQRGLLLAIVAAFACLAVNASLLTPLWELPGEHEQLDVARHWASSGRIPDLRDEPQLDPVAGLQPPLAPLVFALGLRAARLADVTLLARPRSDAAALAPGRQRFLHGPDEIFPFAGPARRLHALRLFSVLPGIATVLLACALGRRLVPGRPAAGLLAAALVAFNPAFISTCGALTADALGAALIAACLLLLADLAADPAPTRRRCLRLGLLLGLALLAQWPAALLLPLVPVALLLRRSPGERVVASLRHVDAIAAGFIVLTGPYLAWNLVTYGDPLAWGFLARQLDAASPESAAWFPRWLAAVATGSVGQLSLGVRAGAPVFIAWGIVAAGALLGLRLAWTRRRPVAFRLAGLLALAVLLNLLGALLIGARLQTLPARALLPSTAALAALLALGWSQLVWPVLAAAGAATLAWLAFHAQVHVLGPSSWLPDRVHDPHLLIFDALAAVPPERRLDTLPLTEPEDGSAHVLPPTLRWFSPTDPEARYTVHVTTPGVAGRLATFESRGLSVRDRFTIPDATWYALPPGDSIVCQVLRLPTLREALQSPAEGLCIEQSPELSLRRVRARSPRRRRGGSAGGGTRIRTGE